jgi:hypothetical protein
MKTSATDTAAWAAGRWQAIPQTTLTGSAADIGGRVRDIAAHGITEIIYQPIGPDDPAELETFRPSGAQHHLRRLIRTMPVLRNPLRPLGLPRFGERLNGIADRRHH